MVTTRPQKITFDQMRDIAIGDVLIYWADYRCGHSVPMNADRWPDDVRFSDLEDRFVCAVCGQRGAEVRPKFPMVRSAMVRPKCNGPSAGLRISAGVKACQKGRPGVRSRTG